jgi:arylsulfatase
VTLFYDGRKVGEGKIPATQPIVFSADETTDIGEDFGMPVSSDYSGENSRFNGKIELVQIDMGEDDNSHLIDPEELMRVAMSRQ